MSKKSKSTTKNEPWEKAQPYILGAADDLSNSYAQNMGTIQNSADSISGLLPSIVDKYTQGNAGVQAAQGYNTDVLNGKYLDQGNPYLQSMIDQSINDTTNATQASLGLRGLTGGSSYADIISKNAANTALGMRYADYGSERDRMANAASQAGTLAAAEEIPLASALSAAGASMMPIQAASGYAGSLGGLLGGYGTQTTTNKQGLGSSLGGLLGAGLSGWASGGFKGL